jgi:hypothetical protein
MVRGWTAAVCLSVLAAIPAPAAGPKAIEVEDADGRKQHLNAPGRISVVIASNQTLQERTRLAGRACDRFQGLPRFRSYVLVDLRGSLAHWAKGYTVRRMRKDLDAEAERIAPWVRKNGSTDDPRTLVSAIPDFEGGTCRALGWEETGKNLRVVVFGPDGRVRKLWNNLEEYAELEAFLGTLREEMKP